MNRSHCAHADAPSIAARESPAPFRDLARSCSAKELRTWAIRRGIDIAPTGGLPRYLYEMYAAERHTRREDRSANER
jgi:hypothetical protein